MRPDCSEEKLRTQLWDVAEAAMKGMEAEHPMIAHVLKGRAPIRRAVEAVLGQA